MYGMELGSGFAVMCCEVGRDGFERISTHFYAEVLDTYLGINAHTVESHDGCDTRKGTESEDA